MFPVVTWTIGILLLINVAAWPIAKDGSILLASSDNEDTDDLEIDKILISADITLSQSRKSPPPPAPDEDVFDNPPDESSGQVDDTRNLYRQNNDEVLSAAASPRVVAGSVRQHTSADSPIEMSDRSQEPFLPQRRQLTADTHLHEFAQTGGSTFPPAIKSALAEETADDQQDQTKEESSADDSNNSSTTVDSDDSLEDETDSPLEQNKERLPTALQNLPRDIPNDRTISDILAENTIKDKQYDEMRIEELIDELMAHTLGFGEVYSSDTE